MTKILPIAVFVILLGFLARGLTLDPREVPSPFVGKPAPELQAVMLGQDDAQFDSSKLLGEVWILNIWASWCVACVQEHQLFNQLARQNDVMLVGLNYKDKPDEANAWLGQLGNPYDAIVQDIEGRVGLDWGVYGVPETFIIDQKGIVQHKFIGPVTDESMTQTLLPLLASLQGKAS